MPLLLVVKGNNSFNNIGLLMSIKDAQRISEQNQGIPREILRQEKWTHIRGYKGLYEASTAGRIRSTITGKIKIPTPDKDKYLKVSLYKNGSRINHRVHLLIGKTWKKNPKKKKEINHKDGIKWHNWTSNLQWTTRSENMLHCWRTGLRNNKK